MGHGSGPPLGMNLAHTGRVVSRAFSEALEAAGGSLPVWLVVLALSREGPMAQHELAGAAGIRSPTMTRHLDNMEAADLVARTRDPGDRRIVRVALTGQGRSMFQQLRTAAAEFDRRLRQGLTAEDVAVLEGLLERVRANADADPG